MDANALLVYVALIVVAHARVLRPDDETDVSDAAVRERADDVVEKRTSNGNHSLDACVGNRGLLRGKCRARVRAAHTRAKPASEDDCLCGAGRAHAACHRNDATTSATAAACPSGFTLSNTRAMRPSASITNVVRFTPQYFRPYIDFSAQTP